MAAPRLYVFQCLSTFSRQSPIWQAGLEPEVLAEDGPDLIVRLRTRQLGRVVAGIHRVWLRAPDCVQLELLDGAVGTLKESYVLEADGESTWLTWQASAGLSLPLPQRLVGPLLRALLVPEARATLARHRVTIEAAALASGRTIPPRPEAPEA